VSEMVWRGDELVTATEEAARLAIDETAAACVIAAKQIVPVVTTVLQGSIQMRPAKVVGSEVVGEWGSYGVNYAIYVETIPAVNSTGQRPFLRPVADEKYPQLADLIQKHYRRLTK